MDNRYMETTTTTAPATFAQFGEAYPVVAVEAAPFAPGYEVVTYAMPMGERGSFTSEAGRYAVASAVEVRDFYAAQAAR